MSKIDTLVNLMEEEHDRRCSILIPVSMYRPSIYHRLRTISRPTFKYVNNGNDIEHCKIYKDIWHVTLFRTNVLTQAIMEYLL